MLKIALKLMADKWLRCLKSEYVRFKHYERKPKWPFMIYGDFESILLPDDNGKQSLGESYTNKYQKHVVCSMY